MMSYRYKLKTGGAKWSVYSDRKLTMHEVVETFMADLKEGRAPRDGIGLLGSVKGPGLGRGAYLVMPILLRKHGLMSEKDYQHLCDCMDVPGHLR
jgi:hypothetical protein